MLYIIEVNQRNNAKCWTVNDESDFCSRMAEAYSRNDDTPESGNFMDWVDYLASDLRYTKVYMTDGEALADVKIGDCWALPQLRDALIKSGALSEVTA